MERARSLEAWPWNSAMSSSFCWSRLSRFKGEEKDSALDGKSYKEFVSILIYTINKRSSRFAYHILVVTVNLTTLNSSVIQSFSSYWSHL